MIVAVDWPGLESIARRVVFDSAYLVVRGVSRFMGRVLRGIARSGLTRACVSRVRLVSNVLAASRCAPCHAMPCHAMPCHAMPCHAMPCHAMPCHVMPCHVMSCHVMCACVVPRVCAMSRVFVTGCVFVISRHLYACHVTRVRRSSCHVCSFISHHAMSLLMCVSCHVSRVTLRCFGQHRE